MAQITPTFNYIGTPRNHPDGLCVVPSVCPESVLPCANFDNFVEEQADPPPWWLPTGVSLANVVAAYIPKGAASLNASYANVAHPGTFTGTGQIYDVDTPGNIITATPGWNTSTGWQWNTDLRSHQGVLTGITSADIGHGTGSIVMFFDQAGVISPNNDAYRILVWVSGTTRTDDIEIQMLMSAPIENPDSKFYLKSSSYGNNPNSFTSITTPCTTGMAALAGSKIYLNGEYADGPTYSAWPAFETPPFQIGWSIEQDNGGAIYSNVAKMMGNIPAALFYNVALSQAQLDQIRSNAITAGIISG